MIESRRLAKNANPMAKARIWPQIGFLQLPLYGAEHLSIDRIDNDVLTKKFLNRYISKYSKCKITLIRSERCWYLQLKKVDFLGSGEIIYP